MKTLLALLVAVTTALAGAGGGSTSQPPLLAAVGEGSATRLTAVDRLTLRPVGASTQIGRYSWPSARSPDGARLVLGRDEPAGLRFLGLRKMKTQRATRVGASFVQSIAWVSRRTVLAVVDGIAVVAVDAATGRRLWRKLLRNQPHAVERTTTGLVMLIPPPDGIGATTLLTVDAGGALRSLDLDRIRSGSRQDEQEQSRFVLRYPGLAVDRVANRAYVVGADEPVAEVELGSMTVVYHGGTRSLAKSATGPVREALWLGNGLIAVTGSELHGSDDDEAGDPFGLALLDTREWTWHRIDARTDTVYRADGLILATGATGLTVYALDGTRRFHVFDERVYPQVSGGMAYARTAPDVVAVVDLASGHVVNAVSRPDVFLLAE